jgi:hypothetical protein
MDENGVETPADLSRLLDERGIRLSYSQVWQPVDQTSEGADAGVLVAPEGNKVAGTTGKLGTGGWSPPGPPTDL